MAFFLASKGYQVTGIDGSTVGLNKAQQLAEQKGVELTTVCADLAEYRIEEQAWMGAVLIFCHLPSELRRHVHRQVVAGLRPGGTVLLECYRPEQVRNGTGGPKDKDLLPTLADIVEDFSGLSLLHAESVERDIYEGSHHTGVGAVVQVVAQKQIA